ncbi:MAG: hypothetical protein ACSLFO_10715 [Acidimicrobiales bacterium]
MRTRLLVTAVALALVAGACGGGGDQSAQTGPADAGSTDSGPEADGKVLDFRAESVDGSTVDVSSLRGTDLVIWFWAPW